MRPLKKNRKLTIVMLHKKTRLIDIVCAHLTTIGKTSRHVLSVLTMCDMTSNAWSTSKDHTS